MQHPLRRRSTWTIGPFLCAAALAACEPMEPESAATPTPGVCDMAVEHVRVLDLDQGTVGPEVTVTVAGSEIHAIETPEYDASRACNQRIDGGGRILMPGLNDLHVHIETKALHQAFGQSAQAVDFEAALLPYLARGITGLQVMSGAPDILAYRDRVRDRGSAAPILVVGSPMLSGEPPVLPPPLTRVVTDKTQARAAAREYARSGYDFIKVRRNLGLEVLGTIIDEANQHEMHVAGHLQRGNSGKGIDWSVRDVLTSGQRGFSHLSELATQVRDEPKDIAAWTQVLQACDCHVTSTLYLLDNIAAQITDYERMAQRPGNALVPSAVLHGLWLKPRNPYQNGAPVSFFRQARARGGRLLRSLVQAGVPVVAGSDALNPMLIPGESLHHEIAALRASGLTRLQALQAATTVPADHVPGFENVGRLAPGFRANAILVDGNPLESLEVLRQPVGVMVAGHWLPGSELRATLAEQLTQDAAP